MPNKFENFYVDVFSLNFGVVLIEKKNFTVILNW